jgi:hypothetical protein
MVEVFPILGQPTAAVQPADGALHDPALRQDDESLGLVAAAYDFGLKAGQRGFLAITEYRAGVTTVGKELLEEGELSEQGGQHKHSAIAVLHVGGGDERVQQQAQRVYKDVALLATDKLAAVKPGWIDMGPPFSALFTLWLSMMAAVGLASRSACSRQRT